MTLYGYQMMLAKNRFKWGRGEGHQKVTSLFRGGYGKVTQGDKGEGGVKNLKMEVTSFVYGPLGKASTATL